MTGGTPPGALGGIKLRIRDVFVHGHPFVGRLIWQIASVAVVVFGKAGATLARNDGDLFCRGILMGKAFQFFARSVLRHVHLVSGLVRVHLQTLRKYEPAHRFPEGFSYQADICRLGWRDP
jgi:hypothetical protein